MTLSIEPKMFRTLSEVEWGLVRRKFHVGPSRPRRSRAPSRGQERRKLLDELPGTDNRIFLSKIVNFVPPIFVTIKFQKLTQFGGDYNLYTS